MGWIEIDGKHHIDSNNFAHLHDLIQSLLLKSNQLSESAILDFLLISLFMPYESKTWLPVTFVISSQNLLSRNFANFSVNLTLTFLPINLIKNPLQSLLLTLIFVLKFRLMFGKIFCFKLKTLVMEFSL